MLASFAGFATPDHILLVMLPSHGYQGFRSAPAPSGWIQMGEGWLLWWSGRQIAHVTPAMDGGVRVHLDAWKMWETKNVRAASIAQGKLYAERWCAARLYTELRLREAVARLTDSTPTELPPPMPGLPPTPEQLQQARRVAEMGAKELGRVKEALEPRRPPKVTRQRAKAPMNTWVRAGRSQPRSV